MNALTRHWRQLTVWAVLLVILIAIVSFWRSHASVPLTSRYRTEAVTKGDVVKTVSANGTLNPVTLVNVGTQVSGTVKKLYADFNDHVKAGQILAELDQSLFIAQIKQDEANLTSAKANLRLAQANEKRTHDLYKKDYVAKSDLDQAVEARAAAKAKVEIAQAQIAHDRANLGYTVIRSPVSGVVISRNIDVGQTVAASFQTPTLFQIAEDLTHMQINTSMAEADVGGIKVGQKVNFTVDAFPNRTFTGAVYQIRLNPTIEQNVVTYNVVVDVQNPDRALLPGMTAYVNVIEASRNNVLRVPNAALRFRPQTERNPGQTPASNASKQDVYRIQGNQLISVPVTTGIADNRYTEITGGKLMAGEQLVVEDLSPATGKANSGHVRFRVF
jgi:HlyD family secretion protein